MRIWYDEGRQRMVPLPENLESDYCFQCRKNRPVVYTMDTIVCGKCKIVLYSR